MQFKKVKYQEEGSKKVEKMDMDFDQVKVTTIIPKKYNPDEDDYREPIPEEDIKEVVNKFAEITGGHTRIDSKGIFWNEKKEKWQPDESITLFTVTTKENVKQLRKLIEYAGDLFEQDAMYFEVVPADLSFV